MKERERRVEMFYGDIVREFYRIALSDADRDLVSSHFSGACHHYHRSLQAERDFIARFHHVRFQAHLRHLMMVVHERGDFRKALDESLMNLDERESWNPDVHPIPEPTMFVGDRLGPDVRYPLGIPHSELDVLLKNLKGPCEFTKPPGKAISLRLVSSN